MRYFHREGYIWISLALFDLVLLSTLAWALFPSLFWLFFAFGMGLLVLIAQFFRNPRRQIPVADNKIVYAPADGKVVVIEPVSDEEDPNSERMQVSIFMSPLNVHVNWNPVGGKLTRCEYHPGKFLVAWHPKASTENERTTLVYGEGKTAVWMRQIAGALARRICVYVKSGDDLRQGEEMGFIRFGSRVDLFLPVDAEIRVKVGDLTRGCETVVALLE